MSSYPEVAAKTRSIIYYLFGLVVYFVFSILRFPTRFRRLIGASMAFAAVQLFEAFDEFDVTANTYDPIDFLANTMGIVLGLWLDTRPGTAGTKNAPGGGPFSR